MNERLRFFRLTASALLGILLAAGLCAALIGGAAAQEGKPPVTLSLAHKAAPAAAADDDAIAAPPLSPAPLSRARVSSPLLPPAQPSEPVQPSRPAQPPDPALQPEPRGVGASDPLLQPQASSPARWRAAAPSAARQLLAPPLAGDNANFVVSMGSDRAWGLVDPGATVTVTVDGVQMGAAHADGVGFFWTTLYDGNGDRPALSGGELVAIYADGVQVASTTLRAISGVVDVTANTVTGTLGGGGFPISVTVYTLDDYMPEATLTTYSVTVSTDDSGSFGADVSGGWDFVGWDHAVVAYVEGGIEVQGHARPLHTLMVRPFPWNWVFGAAAPHELLTVTLYLSDTVTVKEAITTTTDINGFYFVPFSESIDETDVVALARAGWPLSTRVIDRLTASVDADNDRVTGQAEPGATVMARLEQGLTTQGPRSVNVQTTADAATGLYTITFAGVADLLPGVNIPVFVDDAEGDNLNVRAVAPLVQVNQTWDEVSGNAPAPPGPLAEGRTVTLTVNGDVFVGGMGSYGSYYFGPGDGLPDIGPGDAITVEAEGYAWQGVVHAMTMTVQHDAANDRFTGSVEEPTDQVEVWGRQWNGWAWETLFPVAESFIISVTANSPFTATPPGFDVRSAVNYEVRHRTAGDYLETLSGLVDFVRVWPDYNGAIALFSPPGTPYTLTLRDGNGAFKGQITGVSGEPIGSAGWNSFEETGAQIADGDIIEAQSAAGFDQTIEIVPLSTLLVEGSDTVSGYGPPNALLNVNVVNESYGFVPTGPDGAFTFKLDQLQVVGGNGILDWGEWVRLCYVNDEGNHVCRYADWPQITVRTFMDGRNDVWGDHAIPGNPIHVTVTHPVSGVIATGTTSAGTGWGGPRFYYLEFDDGILETGVTVTVDWGDDLVDSVEVIVLTGTPDPDTDLVVGNAPPDSTVSLWVHDMWGNGMDLNGVAVDSSGVYTADFGANGWDIQYGDSFSVYAPTRRNHQQEYNFWLPYADLQIEKQQTPGHARPGGTYIYHIHYWNNGNGEAENALITDTLPLSTTYFADTSGFPVIDGGVVITWELGTVPPYSYHDFYVALLVDSGVPTQTQLSDNCVGIATTSAGDLDPGNNWYCTGGPWVDESEVGVGVRKWPDPNDPHPGQEFHYYIDYWSNGNAATGPVWLTDTLPLSTTFVRWEEEWGWGALWTEVVTTGGQFVLHAPLGIPGQMGGRIRLTLLLDAGVPLGTRLTNRVEVATPVDNQPHDNSYTDTSAQASGPRYDLRVHKNSGSGIQTPGGNLNYGLHCENRGNVAIHAWLTDTLPVSTTYQPGSAGWCDWSGCTPFDPVTVTEEYVVWDLGIVGVGQWQGFGFNVDVDPLAATGPITNCAAVGSAYPESTPEDNTACVVDTIYPHGPNLRVIKGHEWQGDGRLSYWVEVRNIGDEGVSNALVTDTYPLSTTFSGEWWLEWWWPFELQLTHNYTDSQLLWKLEQLDAGWGWRVRFNMDLDDPGMPLRWYTNTVQVTEPAHDPSPEDNVYVDVAFSGGEVRRVEMWVGTENTDMWGEGIPGPVTITTPYTQVVVWGDPGCNGCWSTGGIGPLWPGETVTVTAGAGAMPVVITVPDPFTAEADSASDEVWGQIAGAANQQIQIEGYWPGGHRDVWTNAAGQYSVTYPDVPRGAEGHVRYQTTIDYAEVVFHRRFRTADLVFTVNYSHDWVEGSYEAGHTVWLTVTDSLGAIRATAELTTGVIPWWGGQTGFATHLGDPWHPQRPDIEVGDWVHGTTETGYTTTVRIGEITGYLDLDNDRITGTVHASWFEGLLNGQCWIDGIGNSGREFSIDADGGTYTCDFSDVWDLTPNESVSVQYQEPDGDWVRAVFQEPTPHLRVEKWLDGGNAGEGGNAVFTVQYRNEGNDDAEDVVITDTLQGMTYLTDTLGIAPTGGGGQVVWNLGTVPPGNWIQFYVFASVTASEGEWITNTVEIATSDPYDQGDEWEKRSEWSGQVQSNDTQLNVGKWAWTGDPAPGSPVVFHVNVCNNGGTASTEVVITDTLHPSLTLHSWWSDTPGWSEISSGANHLVVSKPAVSGWRCEGVFVRAIVDGAAWPGLSIWNHAVITAVNDLTPDDNEAWWWGNVNWPHVNLGIEKDWDSGQLVPGGEIRYNLHYHNHGNVPVGNVLITDTLPAGVTFLASYTSDQSGQHPFPPVYSDTEQLVWNIGTLDNGVGGNIQVVLRIDPGVAPGTALTNTARILLLSDDDDPRNNVSTLVETVHDHGLNLRVRKYGRWHDWGENTRRVSWQVAVENIGDERVEWPVIADTYPVGMFREGGLGVNYWRWWNWEDYGDHFTVTLEVLYPGETAWLYFDTIVPGGDPLPFGQAYTNTVEVTPYDDYPEDNVAVRVLTTGPDLYVGKALRGGELLPGELVTYTLSFGNQANGTGYWQTRGDVLITDTLPAGLDYVTSTLMYFGWGPLTPYLDDGEHVAWNLGQMCAGCWGEILLTARVSDTVTGLDTITNQVEIATTAPLSDTEYDTSNNWAVHSADVPLPYFEVSKVYESSAVAGTLVTYTLTVTNVGHGASTGVVLSDTLPAGLTYSDSDGTHYDSGIWWGFASIAAEGGTADGWFSAALPCTPGAVTNNDYRVVGSNEGVHSAPGPAVAFDVVAPDLDASFKGSRLGALVGVTLFFTDTSTTDGVAIVGWEWDWGDGSAHAFTPNASHAYLSHGTFTVTLVVTDGCGYVDAQESTVTIDPPDLVASFDQSAAAVVVGSTVHFTDTSTTDGPPIVAWAWTFGDGGTSTDRNPSHLYDTDGAFVVTLTVTDALGYSDAATSTVTVTAPDLHADFDYSPKPAHILVGDTVHFTDTSTTDGPPIVAWAWDFGDSGTSSAQHPSHVYTAVGTYTVSLVVTDGLGYSDTEVKPGIVVVSPRCTALVSVTFTYAPLGPVVGTPVVFTAAYGPLNATSPITYTWNFGDSTTLTVNTAAVSHTYATSNTYTVILTATNPCTPAGVRDQHEITVAPRRIYLPLILRRR